MAKRTISLGSKVAHSYARTDPPGLFGKSMLAEVQALTRVLDPSRAVLVGVRLQVRSKKQNLPLSPQPGTYGQLHFLRWKSGRSSTVDSTTLGTHANPTFMMRKTDRENNRLLANRHRQE